MYSCGLVLTIRCYNGPWWQQLAYNKRETKLIDISERSIIIARYIVYIEHGRLVYAYLVSEKKAGGAWQSPP